MRVENKTLVADHPFLDFRVFLTAVWEHLGLPQPNQMQLDLAYELQHGTDRDVYEAFRGAGKSWITCTYVCWTSLLDPSYQTEIISAGEDLALANATFIQALIADVPFLQHLKPRANQRSAKTGFDLGPAPASKDPSVKAVGILGMITGTRADEIIADDIEIPKNSDSQGQRDKIQQLVTEFESILKPHGNIKFLGTPQLTDSLYTRLPPNYRVIVWPSEYPSIDKIEKSDGKYAQYIVDNVLSGFSKPGDAVEPLRFPKDVLEQKKLGMGVSNYNLQFLLDTDASDETRFPLKTRDLIVMDLDRTEGSDKVYYASSSEQELTDLHIVGLKGDRYYKPLKLHPGMSVWERILLAIDPSGTGKDETSYCILKQLNSQIFLAEWGGLKGGYDDPTLAYLSGRAEFHEITNCLIEKNFGGGMFNKLFQPWLNQKRKGQVLAEDIHHSMQKEARIIDTLEPVMNQHRLIVDRKVIEDDYESVKAYPGDTAYRYRGFYQLTHITREKNSLGHDDRIDCLAMGVSYLLDHMDINQRQHADSLQLERDTKEMKVWVSINGTGSAQKKAQGQPNWMNF